MSAPPYMKLYIADYHGDTTHLGALEHGVYLLLLMAMWRAGGKLPADDAKLCRLAKCSPDQWAEMRSTILEFFRRRGGSLTHKRVSSEIAKYETVSVKRKAASEAGVIQKRCKNSDKAQPNGSPKADHLVAKPEPEPEPVVSSEDKSSGGEPPTVSAKAWNTAKALLVAQGGMTEKSAGQFFGKLLATHNLEPGDLYGAIAEAEHNRTADPQGWLTKSAQARSRRREPTGPPKRQAWC